MSDSTSLPSPSELAAHISFEKELLNEMTLVKLKNTLAIAEILLPAAMRAASEEARTSSSSHSIMKAAVYKAWPYIKSL